MTDFDTSSGLGGGAILRETVTEISQNAGLNTSLDSYALYLIKGAYASFDLSGTTWSHTIDGTTTSGSFTFDFRVTSSVLITSGTKTITHNADGTKTISVSGGIGTTGTSTGGPATAAGSFAQTTIPPSVPAGAVVSRLSHTLTQPMEYLALATTEATALAAIQATAAEITLATLPTDLSVAAITLPSSGSALDAFNKIIRTEQGYIYTATTGTLTAPVQKVYVRARSRPSAVTYSFGLTTDILDAPQFVRDITNTVSRIDVSGPSTSVSVTDATLVPLVGSANTSESVLNTTAADLTTWGQDRLLRGKNTTVRIASFTVDAYSTTTSRWADLAAMVFGDRIRVTGLPTTQLGYSTWDGWLIGVDREHIYESHKFTLHVAAAMPDTAIYDTNLFMADGALTLFSSITNVATSMSVIPSVATTLLETVTFPYTLIIDSEQVTVTACNTAAPQVATITRGVNGTTAAAHSAAALVEVAVPSLYAF
jgi:hypothetical protein